jgi:response regulator RpfG family c-di-GMP phosphodiesterase
MNQDQLYRSKMTKAQIIKELKNNAGTQFDPVLVDKFIKMI